MRISIDHERGTDLAGIRRENLHRVLDVARRHPGSSQNDIAARTGLAVGAVSSLVNELRDAGVLVEAEGTPTGGRGRPKRAVELADDRIDIVGVDLTRSRIEVRAATLRGTVRGEAHSTVRGPMNPEQAALALPRLVDEAIGSTPVAALGPRIVITVPGAVRAEGIGATELEWAGAAQSVLTQSFVERGWPVPLIGNDGSLAAFAEARAGTAQNHANAVVLYLGRGLGGSAVIDGALIRGATVAPGFGHTPLDPNGEPCACGLRGCAEFSVSLLRFAQLLDEAKAIDDSDPQSYAADLARRAAAGDAAVLRVLETASATLTRLGAVVVAMLNPEIVVLTGPGEVLAHWLLPAAVGNTAVPTAVGAYGADVVIAGALAAAQELVLADPLRTGEPGQSDWL